MSVTIYYPPEPGAVFDARQALREAEGKEAAWSKISEAQRLAIVLHAKMCRVSHSDDCRWQLENQWHDMKHAHYLAMAQKRLAVTDYQTNIQLLEIE